MEWIWPGYIELVNWPAAKGEKCGKGGIHDVSGQQVQQNHPAVGTDPARPRMQDYVPEEQRRHQKADVLEVMHALMTQSEVIGFGQMPGEKDNVEN